MNLHENKELYVDAILSASQHLGIKASYVERLLDNAHVETNDRCR